MRLKNILSHEVHVTSRCDDETARSTCRAHWVVQLARVGVRVILVDVVCVMLVLIARVDIRAVDVQFS